jgi:hypothetical protein
MINTKYLNFIILIGLIPILLVLRQGKAEDAQIWHTKIPLSDAIDSVIYQTLSNLEGKHYETTLYGRDLTGVAKWEPGKELPVSMSSITANAHDAFCKNFPQFSRFKITSINLIHLGIVDAWIFDVEFNGTDYAAANAASIKENKLNILVLLNGRVIMPIEAAK